MKFAPLQSFRTEKPESLDEDLTRFTDETARALTALENERAARWAVRRFRGATAIPVFNAAFGDLLIVNTEDADVYVRLPRLSADSAGREIAYARYDAANDLRFQGANGALINGAATFTAAAAVGRGVNFINDGSDWWAA